MTTTALDPLIHNPARLRIVATLAVLAEGEALAATRLRHLVRLPPGGLIIRLRELDDAGYVRTTQARGSGQAAIVLTRDGRAALHRYTAELRQLARTATEDREAPAPELRVGDADRDAAATALGEHFAQGRLTLDELTARLDAALTATTHGELAQAARDLPTPRPAATPRRQQASRPAPSSRPRLRWW